MTPTPPQWTECLPDVWDRVLFSTEHKVNCHWHVVVEQNRWTVVDPFEGPEPAAPWRPTINPKNPGRVVLTNTNHQRESGAWTQTMHLPLWDESSGYDALEGWEVFPLPGGAIGELATRPLGARYWILGDSLVNLPGRGLEILPARYCTDPMLLRCSLEGLLKTPFDSLLFAHGTPILVDARRLLARLLNA